MDNGNFCIMCGQLFNSSCLNNNCRQQQQPQQQKPQQQQQYQLKKSYPIESAEKTTSDPQISTSLSPSICHPPITESLHHSTSIYSSTQLDNLSLLILRDLNRFGICVIDQFLPNGDPVLEEVLQLYSAGVFSAGQVVHSSPASAAGQIRGDQVLWLRGCEAKSVGLLMATFDELISRCSNHKTKAGEFKKYQISGRTKAMVACYPGNFAKYVRHVDNPNGDGRCVTAIYYLNKNYDRVRDGGILRIFPEMNLGTVADIEPIFNRAVFFWSDKRCPHEVMPATRLRFAITVWYIDAKQRKRKEAALSKTLT